MRDAAQGHAGVGLRVFPLQPGSKQPRRRSRGVLDATSDPIKVAHWFAEGGAELNFGVACGVQEGGWHLLVVDVDMKSGGMESYTKLALERGFPDTYTVQTPGGGWHHYYRAVQPVRNTASRVAPGIDTRGEGGYVVGAGSVVEDVAYRVVSGETPIADAPAWLLADVVGEEGEDTPPSSSTPTRVTQVTEGARNASLASLAGTMRRRGMDQDVIETALIGHNQRHCLPPLSTDEVVAVARSVAQYDPEPEPVEHLTWGDSPGQTVADYSELTAESARVEQMIEEDPPPVEMLVEGLLPAKVTAMVAGAGGVGKTTILTEMATAMAGGRRIFGYWAPPRPLKVALLIKEDDREDLWRMLHRAARAPVTPADSALRMSTGEEAAFRRDLKANLRARSLIGRRTVLIDQDGKRAVQSAFVPELMAYLERLRDDLGGLDVLMLDPLRRFSNCDENDSNAANQLIEVLDRIRDHFGVTVIVTHHLRKGAHVADAYASRGSSALEDGGRFVLNVGRVSEESELAQLGLEVSEGWGRYLRLVNVKNTKMRLAEQVVVERTAEGYLDFVGTVVDLRGASRPGAAKAVSNYDTLIPDILLLLAEQPGVLTAVSLAKEYGGVDGHFGIGRDTLRAACEAGVARGEIEVVAGEVKGKAVEYLAPLGWEGYEGTR